jgi:hypothetical protein
MNKPWLAQPDSLFPVPRWWWLPVLTGATMVAAMLVNLPHRVLQAQDTVLETTATTYYVATNGNDSNPGTEAQPFRTIQKGVDRAQAGETVYVRGGTYHEEVKVNNSGAENRPIIIAAYPNERPVIDGEYTLPENTPVDCNNNVNPPRCFVWEPLVQIKANYIRFSGFELLRSQGRGIVVSRNANTAIHHIDIDNCLIHDVRHGPISIQNASYVTVDRCVVYHGTDYVANNQDATNFNRPNSVTAVGADHITVRNSTVYANWGVGIGANTDADYFTIENNVIYDNYGMQIYIHRSQHVIVRNNLVYHTNDPEFRRSGDPSSCIVINNEAAFPDSQTVADVQITGNIATGCQRNFTIWTGNDNNYRIDDVYLANNTFVEAVANSQRNAANVFIGDANLHNVRLEKNIIYQSTRMEQAIGGAPNNAQISYNNNLWSRRPPEHMISPTDIIADPQLRNPLATLTPGDVQVAWFCPLPGSPALPGNLGAQELCTGTPPSATNTPTTTVPPTTPPTATLLPPTNTPQPGVTPPPTPTRPAGGTPAPNCTPPSTSVLSNHSFESGIDGWFFSTNGRGSYTATPPGIHCTNAAQVQITKVGSNVQLYQKAVTLEPNTHYRLSFAAYSNTGHDLSVYLHKNAGRHTDYGLRNAKANLNERWRIYTIEFTTTGFTQPVTDGRLRFWFSPYDAANDVYWIDRIELSKVNGSRALTDTDLGVEIVALTLEPEEPPPSQGVVHGAVQLRGDDGAIQPAVEAQVMLADAETNGDTYQTIIETDSDGMFYFEGMPVGNYLLTVAPPPGFTAPEPITLTITGAEQLDYPYTLTRVSATVYLPVVDR